MGQPPRPRPLWENCGVCGEMQMQVAHVQCGCTKQRDEDAALGRALREARDGGGAG